MDSIIEQYLLLVEKISNTTKTFHSFGTDVDIYRSEIHVIQLIGDRASLHLAEVARLIGVTKGTVSQIVKRLESKGLVEKRVDEENNTRQLISLTGKGETAYRAHVSYHNRNYQDMLGFLKDLSDGDRLVLEEFLNKAYEMIKEHI